MKAFETIPETGTKIVIYNLKSPSEVMPLASAAAAAAANSGALNQQQRVAEKPVQQSQSSPVVVELENDDVIPIKLEEGDTSSSKGVTRRHSGSNTSSM